MRCGWLGLLVLLVACGGEPSDSAPIDAFVVVQETNLTACQLDHSYSRTVTRSCDGVDVPVGVCSEEALCEAQLVDLTRPIADCANSEETFMATTVAACD